MKLFEVTYLSSKHKEPQVLRVVAMSGVDAVSEVHTRKYKGHKQVQVIKEVCDVIIAGEKAPPSPRSAYLREYFKTKGEPPTNATNYSAD